MISSMTRGITVLRPFDLATMSRDVNQDWKGRVSLGLDGEKGAGVYEPD